MSKIKQIIIVLLVIITVSLCFTCKTQYSNTTTINKEQTLTLDNNSVKKSITTVEFDKVALEEYKANDVNLNKALVKKSLRKPNGTLSINKSNKQPVVQIPSKTSTDVNQVDGAVVYFIPKEMSVRNIYSVYVKISKSRVIIKEYNNDTLVKTAVIPVTQQMEARLVDLSSDDNKAFSIVTENTSMQFLSNDSSYTEWNWSVTPLRAGTNKLSIVISIIKDNIRKEQVYQDTINVKINVKNQILFFIKTYWQVLLTSIIIPLIIFFYKKYKDKKNK